LGWPTVSTAIRVSADTDGTPWPTRSIRDDADVRRLELTLTPHAIGPRAQQYRRVFLMLYDGGSIRDLDVPDVEAGRNVPRQSVVSEHGHTLRYDVTMTGKLSLREHKLTARIRWDDSARWFDIVDSFDQQVTLGIDLHHRVTPYCIRQ
jgi:hypothetical protein